MAFGIDDALAIGGFVSKLFGGSSAKKQMKANIAQTREVTRGNPQWIREGAEAAGFNPTAFIAPPVISSVQTGPSFGERLADAAQGALGYISDQEQLELQKTELDQRERELKLREKQAEKMASVSVLPTPQAMAGKPKPGTAIAQAAVTATGDPVTDYTIAGKPVKANPAMSDAEAIEARHGDVASSLYGVATMTADFLHNQNVVTEEKLTRWGEKAAKGAKALRKVAEEDKKERERKRSQNNHHVPGFARDGLVMRAPRSGAGWPYTQNFQLNGM